MLVLKGLEARLATGKYTMAYAMAGFVLAFWTSFAICAYAVWGV